LAQRLRGARNLRRGTGARGRAVRMEPGLGLESLARQAAVAKQHRAEAARAAQARVARAEAKAEAMEKAAAQLRLRHAEQLAAAEATTERQAAGIRARSERTVSELEEQTKALRARRRAAEVQADALLQEAEAISCREAEQRSRLDEEAAASDLRSSEALVVAQEQVDATATAAGQYVQGLIKGLRADCQSAWAPDPEWEQALTGVRSAQRDQQFQKACAPRQLPFGEDTHWPFDGLGTRGKTPTRPNVKGFYQETELRLLERLKLPPVELGGKL